MKRIVSLLLAALLCAALTVPAYAATQFSDVPSTFWAYKEINEAVKNGITNGYADGTFKPYNSVTNAHFAAFLARAFYADEYTEGGNPWYKPYTDVLSEHGVFDRTALGKDMSANINKPINRYDMAQMMRNILTDKNAYDKMPTNAELDVARSKIGDWNTMPPEYCGAVSLCYAMGVLNGQSDGTFGGENLMNRAQGCVVVYRLTQKLEGGSTGIEQPEEKPTEPEEPSTPSDEQTLANGKPVTEENVLELIDELKATKYPEDFTYDAYNPPYYSSAFGKKGMECAKFAFMLSDDIFGKTGKARALKDPWNMKPGDVIEAKTSDGKTYHWAIIIGVDYSTGRFRTVGGDRSGKILWNDDRSWPGAIDNMGCSVIWTRYPD